MPLIRRLPWIPAGRGIYQTALKRLFRGTLQSRFFADRTDYGRSCMFLFRL